MTLMLLMWKWMGLFLRENHLLRCWGWLALLNCLGSYIIFIAKTASKKIEALIRSMKSLSPEVGLCLYKSAILLCMEYCCHFWADVTSCYLELSNKLQKRICGTAGPSLTTFLELLLLFLFLLVQLAFSGGRCICYSDRLHNFSVTIPRYYKDV